MSTQALRQNSTGRRQKPRAMVSPVTSWDIAMPNSVPRYQQPVAWFCLEQDYASVECRIDMLQFKLFQVSSNRLMPLSCNPVSGHFYWPHI
jgi:hypothetical protein